MVKIKKKAIIIPTPGQTEQEYLARYTRENKASQFKVLYEGNIEEIHGVIDSFLIETGNTN